MSELPKSWTTAPLGELGHYQNGRAFSEREWVDEGRPIIRIQNLTGSGPRFNHFAGEAEERHVVRRGDLLVSWAATLGVYVWNGPEAVLNQHIFKVRSFIDPGYHRYALEWALALMRRDAHGSGMVHITKGKFDAVEVPLAPDGEQRRIVDELDRRLSHLDAAVNGLHTSRRRLATARAAIGNRTFLGLWHASENSEIPSLGRTLERPVSEGPTRGVSHSSPDLPQGWPDRLDRGEGGRLGEI